MKTYKFNPKPGYFRQRGISLFISLIALVAMTFAGLALIRAVDTTNLISGNLAFRQASLHATDVGVESAYSELGTIISTSLDSNYPSGCSSGSCKYYPIKQTINSTTGIPTVINWNNVPKTTVDSVYSVQYVLDRLCDGPAPVTDIASNCMRSSSTSSGSKKSGATVFSSANQVYYRATIRVTGPRNTTSLVQVIFLR